MTDTTFPKQGDDFYDSFPELTKKIGRLWRENPLTDLNWQRSAAPVPGTEPSDSYTRPFWVSASFEGQTVNAIAKPVARKFHKPFAGYVELGHESPVLDKIASDMAYDLGLPVPPSALWEHEGQQYVLSLEPFPAAVSGDYLTRQIGAVADLHDHLIDRHLPALTAMTIFNMFVAQGDDHNGNLLLPDTGTRDGGRSIAFIDFQTAFHESTFDNGRPHDQGVVDFLPSNTTDKTWGKDHILRAVDTEVAERTAQKIWDMDLDRIGKTIDAIPDSFMTPSQKERLKTFLDESKNTFPQRLGNRFGYEHADERWPAIVRSSSYDNVPQDLVSFLPNGDHIQEAVEDLRKARAVREPRPVESAPPFAIHSQQHPPAQHPAAAEGSAEKNAATPPAGSVQPSVAGSEAGDETSASEPVRPVGAGLIKKMENVFDGPFAPASSLDHAKPLAPIFGSEMKNTGAVAAAASTVPSLSRNRLDL